MMRTIRLYGRLADMVGQRVFRIYARTVYESARFLCVNYPNIAEQFIADSYHVYVGDKLINDTEVSNPLGGDDITFVPVIQGSFPIAIGAALIAGGVFLPVATVVATALIGVGVSLVLSGVSQLLSPTPRTFTPTASGLSNSPSSLSRPSQISDNTISATKDDPRSTAFSNISNTSRQGLPIPIQYGEVLVGSITISIGQQTVNRA